MDCFMPSGAYSLELQMTPWTHYVTLDRRSVAQSYKVCCLQREHRSISSRNDACIKDWIIGITAAYGM